MAKSAKELKSMTLKEFEKGQYCYSHLVDFSEAAKECSGCADV